MIANILFLWLALTTVTSFRTNFARVSYRSVVLSAEESSSSESSSPQSFKKGFGKAPTKPAEVAVEKDAGTKTYEIQAKRGVPEYNIFIRPANGTDTEWIPVGSMTIPRDTKVSKVVYEVEEELLKGAFKLFPKLRAYYELQGGAATGDKKKKVFEYGSCLKAFPDEPITVLVKEEEEEEKPNFFQSWLGKITNPLDTTELKNKGDVTLRM